MRELPTGTVTLLFTDIEGSTGLLHELGPERYGEVLAKHRRVLREAFAGHGGVEVDTQGDAFFVAFPHAAAAVAAAEDAQRRLAEGPIAVRIGLHTGTPHVIDEGYVGEDVHLGARVAAAGHGGQVLLTAPSRATLEPGNSLVLVDLGEHRLKDFDRPVAIFQLGDRPFPPLKMISNTNLPRPASSFVGRERDVAEVTALLRHDHARLVTMTGPGGTGKTRLAIEASAELVPEFRGGVFWVPLATIHDPELVVPAIAGTLGGDGELAKVVGTRELLLVVDNLEQVIDAAPELAALVEACPNLRLLVTSRELVHVRGEVEYEVRPLADADAVALFSERSRLPESHAVEELCRRLDNMPLALELGRRSDEGALAGADPRAALAAARPLPGRPRRRPAAADAVRDDRVVVRAALRRGEVALRAARRVPRRLHARRCGDGVRRGARRDPVARREEPAAADRRALLDAGDDPRVRRRAARGVR